MLQGKTYYWEGCSHEGQRDKGQGTTRTISISGNGGRFITNLDTKQITKTILTETRNKATSQNPKDTETTKMLNSES